MKRANDFALSTEEAQHASCISSVYEQLQTSRNPIFPHAQAPEFLSEPTFVGHSR